MHRNLLIFCVVVLFVGAIIALNIRSVESQSDMAQRGKYLVDAVGCVRILSYTARRCRI